MSRRWYPFLLLVPLSIAAPRAGLPGWLVFFLSLGAVIPLAALISAATEQAALAKGPKVGGILNATFGNVPDLLVGYFGVREGLIDLVKATLIGGVISNTGLIIGVSFFVAGIRHRYPRFDAREAGRHTVLMLLAVAGMLLLSIAAATSPRIRETEGLSITVSVILLIAYLAYVAFSVFGIVGGTAVEPEKGESGRPAAEEAAPAEKESPRWSILRSGMVLFATTGALALVTDVLVSSVTPAVKALGWTEVFVGIVFVANAGNAAEFYTAVVMGLKGRLNLTLNVASGSSIQIAAFVTPLVVLISRAYHPMDLVFPTIELGIISVVVAIFAYISFDGETNWLEGLQLVAIYVMAAAVFFALPGG